MQLLQLKTDLESSIQFLLVRMRLQSSAIQLESSLMQFLLVTIKLESSFNSY